MPTTCMLTHAVVVELFPRFDSKRVSHEMFHTNALHCNLSSSRLPDETGRTVAAVLALPVRFTICAGSYAKKYKRWVVNLNIEKQKKRKISFDNIDQQPNHHTILRSQVPRASILSYI